MVMALTCAQAEMRQWTHSSGRTIDAEYVSTTLSDEALLQKSDGSQIKVPMNELSPADLDYIALQHPPKLKLEFADSSKVDTLDSSDRFLSNPAVVQEIVQFKVSIRQEGSTEYPFGLTAEYYAIGYQYVDQDKYVLLAKGKEDFSLNNENRHSVEFSTKPIKLPLEFTLDPNHYGQKYIGYIVLVFDQRGELIANRSSKNWLFENREKLRKLPIGAFFDNTCIRRHASSPRPNY